MKQFSFEKTLSKCSSVLTWVRPTGRTYFFWELLVASFTTFALIEENFILKYSLPFLFLLDPKLPKISSRIILGLFSFLAIPLGSALIIFVLPVWGLLRSTPTVGVFVAFGGVVVSSFSPYLVGLLPNFLLPINAQSIIHMLIPNVLPLILIMRRGSILSGQKFILILLSLSLIETMAVSGGWLAVDVFINEFFRILFVGIPIVIFTLWSKIETKDDTKVSIFFKPNLFVALFFIGFLFAFLIVTPKPITKVVFDESHGDWETTVKTFSPSDFGRKHTYTYGLFSDYAKKTVGEMGRHFEGVPNFDNNTVFVIKMPSKSFEKPFKKSIVDWVFNGGRLLVIADHTDLYDSAQILNGFFQGWTSIKIGSNAVFDKYGFPNEVRVKRFQALLGKINSDNSLLGYQTGSAFKGFPLNSVVLSSYGLSFAEPGDYSRPNRFGPLVPKLSLPYVNHASSIGIQYGHGGVVVIADSTQWSNFSIFKKSYKDFFKNLLGAMEVTNAIGLRFYSLIFLTLLLLVILWTPKSIIVLTGSFVLGCIFGFNCLITKSIYKPIATDLKNNIGVISGPAAHLKILPQLIPIGERAYPRIISSLNKYGFDPMAFNRGVVPQNFLEKKNWLFLEPGFNQLPKPSDLRSFLKNNGKAAFFFGPEQAKNKNIISWINQIGLTLQQRKGLGFIEDTTPGLFNRNGSKIIKVVRAATSSPPSSMLVSVSGNTLAQVYQIKTKVREFPKINGRLIIGFAADQFSDAVTGNVWEGIDPSIIGEIREKQFSSYFLDQQTDLQPMHYNSIYTEETTPQLNIFTVVENGKAILSGNINSHQTTQPSDSLGLFPDRYLASIQQLAYKFIDLYCPAKTKIVRCKKHLIGYDMTEWIVGYEQDVSTTKINNIELIHDRNFSGIGANYNIIFSR